MRSDSRRSGVASSSCSTHNPGRGRVTCRFAEAAERALTASSAHPIRERLFVPAAQVRTSKKSNHEHYRYDLSESVRVRVADIGHEGLLLD